MVKKPGLIYQKRFSSSSQKKGFFQKRHSILIIEKNQRFFNKGMEHKNVD